MCAAGTALARVYTQSKRNNNNTYTCLCVRVIRLHEKMFTAERQQRSDLDFPLYAAAAAVPRRTAAWPKLKDINRVVNSKQL